MDDKGRMDDPVDAAFAAWADEPEKVPGETALSFISAFFPPAHAFKAIKDQFSSAARFARAEYLIRALAAKLNLLEARVSGQQQQSNAVRERIESKEFKEGLAIALEETVRATNLEKADQFSSILVSSLDPNIVEDSAADASSLIRDVSQLSAMDLDVLIRLKRVYGHLFPPYPSDQSPNTFTDLIQDFRDAVAGSGLVKEEFQSVCDRLRGFGLAAEVLRNNNRMSLTDYCYRPTRRGLKLLKLLGGSSTT
jgi:hypothetical protein